MRAIEFEFCTVTYEKPVVYLSFKENAEMDVAEVRQLIAAAEELTQKKPYLLFSDARVHLSVSSEGRKISADPKEAPYLVANAVLVNNLAVKLTANFFGSFNKPKFHFEVFNSREKAMKWLIRFDPDNPQPARKRGKFLKVFS